MINIALLPSAQHQISELKQLESIEKQIALKQNEIKRNTLMSRYNDRFYKKIPTINNLILSPSVFHCIVTRTGNRYQAQSNFDVSSFRHQLISSSFFSSRSNRDVTSFPRKQISHNFIVGTYGRTNEPTDGPTTSLL
jgi:hypothetical protein